MRSTILIGLYDMKRSEAEQGRDILKHGDASCARASHVVIVCSVNIHSAILLEDTAENASRNILSNTYEGVFELRIRQVRFQSW